jgi:hypothetical protein
MLELKLKCCLKAQMPVKNDQRSGEEYNGDSEDA